MPDYMHIVHLAVGPDLVCSVLLDLSDPEPGLTREAKLTGLWGLTTIGVKLVDSGFHHDKL